MSGSIPLLQAGATAVVPETLEPSLQLASAVLTQLNMPSEEVAQAIQDFRKTHVSELQVCHFAPEHKLAEVRSDVLRVFPKMQL